MLLSKESITLYLGIIGITNKKNCLTRSKLNSDFIDVYSDGACKYNGDTTQAVAGIGVYCPSGLLPALSISLPGPLQTNNRAELYAILKSIEEWILLLQRKSIFKNRPLRIITDSEYSYLTINQWMHRWKQCGWKTTSGTKVKNEDIIRRIDELVNREGVNVTVILVAGHKGNIGNEEADRLAKLACER